MTAIYALPVGHMLPLEREPVRRPARSANAPECGHAGGCGCAYSVPCCLRCELPACLYDLGAVDDLERFAAQRARAQAITATTLKRVLGHINVSPGLTQAQTARDLGLSRRTVQRVLNSQRSTP